MLYVKICHTHNKKLCWKEELELPDFCFFPFVVRLSTKDRDQFKNCLVNPVQWYPVSCFVFFFVFSKMRVIRRLPKHQNSCSRTRRRMWEIFASISAHAPLSHSREPELDCKLPLYFCLNYNLLFLYRYWSCTGICVLCSTSQYCVWLTWKNKTEGQWFKLCRSRSDEFITEHRCFVHGFVLFFFFCPILIFLIVLKSRFHHT